MWPLAHRAGRPQSLLDHFDRRPLLSFSVPRVDRHIDKQTPVARGLNASGRVHLMSALEWSALEVSRHSRLTEFGPTGRGGVARGA
jgi:hypothetical protein